MFSCDFTRSALAKTGLFLSLILAFTSGCGDARRGDLPPDGADSGTDSGAVMPADAGAPDTAPNPPDAAVMMDVGVDPGPMDAGAPDVGRRGELGEVCDGGADCVSGICRELPDGSGVCTRECDMARPNDCRAERTLCLPTGIASPAAACGGPDINTGGDEDDAILGLGDCVTRRLNPLGSDQDLFRMQPRTRAAVEVVLRPDANVDVAMDFYNARGDLVATSSVRGRGGIEGLTFDSWSPDEPYYIVVRDVGSVIANPYQICVRLTE